MTNLLTLFPLIWLLLLAPPVKYNKRVTDYEFYKIDTAKSILHWRCHHYGSIKLLGGDLTFQDDELVNANLTIDMNSIKNIDIESDLLQGTLENVLKSVEFFEADIFPETEFRLHEVSKVVDNTYRVSGDFVIFNVGICTEFEANIDLKNDSLYIAADSILMNRTDWGIYYLSQKNLYPKEEEAGFVVSDTVMIDVYLQAYKQIE